MRPETTEYPGFYEPYIGLVKTSAILKEFEHATERMLLLFNSFTEEQGNFAYAEGKWTTKQVVQHIIDAERVFTYRAMRFARNDKSPVPGFSENDYANYYNSERRTLKSLIDEFSALRQSTIAFFAHLDDDAMMRSGTANGHTVSVRAIAHIVIGHGIHHTNILQERYQ